MTKPQHHIWLVFKNIPYSDEEWELMDDYRRGAWSRLSRETQERILQKPSYRKYYAPRKTRPVRPIRYGGGAHSETEARRRCEEALEEGAQQVEYAICGPYGTLITWVKRKGGNWYYKK